MYSLQEVRDFCSKRGKLKVLVDTNVLLVLLIGMCDAESLSKFMCTKKYDATDYRLLVDALRYFKPELLLTPHILAEFSAFLRKDVKEPKISHFIHKIIEKLRTCQEEFIQLDHLLGTEPKTLVYLGFSDMSIIEAAKRTGAAILTEDIDLGLYADNSGIPNVKFSALAAAARLT